MAPPAAAAAAPPPGGGTSTNPYLYYRRSLSSQTSNTGALSAGSPLAAAGLPAAGAISTGATTGTIRYTCLPSSYLSPTNRIGWGGPHVSIGVRCLNASPCVGPLAGILADRFRVDGLGEEKKVDDAASAGLGGGGGADNSGDEGVNAAVGGEGGWVHPFRALPYVPSSASGEGSPQPSSADDLIAPQEFTITATIVGLCAPCNNSVSAGSTSSAAEVSTRSVPLVPIALDPGFDANSIVGGSGIASSAAGADPPPVCASTHVARFDDDVSDATSGSGPNSSTSSNNNAAAAASGSSNNNHGEVLSLPLRYRDLSRDATFLFRVYASPPPGCAASTVFGRRTGGARRRPGGGILVATARQTLFDDTGKLRTGLQKLRLDPFVAGSASETDIASINASNGAGEEDEDPLWEATLVLEGIRQTASRAEAAAASAAAPAVGGGGSSSPSRSLAGGGFAGAMSPSSAQAGYGRSRQQQLRGSTTAVAATSTQPGLPGPNYALPNPCGPIPWLDEMTRSRCLEEIEMLRTQIISGEIVPHSTSNGVSLSSETDAAVTPPAHLIIELPDFNIPIVHEEIPYPPPAHGASGTVTAYDVSLYRRQRAKAKDGDNEEYDAGLSLVQVLDYENTNDSHNPVEDKYRTLAHDLLRGHIDPSLKPSRAQRARLSEIISSPSRHPTNEERDLLWRFRFHLVDDRRALSKFLLAVDWSQPSEVVQAAELLEQWRSRSPIEVTDALRLLGKDVSDRAGLRHAGLVREYAIETLGKAEDGELRLYLLQLVQAIKYEAEEEDGNAAAGTAAAKARKDKKKRVKSSRSLASFLIDRASRNLELANYLYWYVRVELSDPTHGTHYKHVFDSLKDKLSNTIAGGNSGAGASSSGQIRSTQGSGNYGNSGEGGGGGSSSSSVHSYSVKSALRGMKGMGAKLEKALLHHGPGHDHSSSAGGFGHNTHPSMWDVLTSQDRLISGIMDCQRRAREARGKKDAKEVFLRDALAAEGYGKIDGGIMTPGGGSVPLPSAPSVMVTGVRAESVRMFKSALYPAVVEFNVGRRGDADDDSKNRGRDVYTTRSELSAALAGTDNHAAAKKAAAEAKHSTFKVIVKTGDDLRQDQLVIMMIQLMDRLLKRATLDLCLKPYAILATSPNTGLVEYVDGSIPISQILANNNNSVLQYFKSAAPRQGAKYGINPDVMQTYIRSCAGYCVITYLMGVGDRHLDNIMLQASGNFFHIDFGFIFGRDPKPLPPAFRLTREMVDGMGGTESSEYARFRSLSCQAFNTLRKSAGLVLNLLHLMGEAGIEDLSNNPAADAEGVISKVEERFRLELTDEQAEAYFLGLIDESLSALAPRVMEVFHQLSVARR